MSDERSKGHSPAPGLVPKGGVSGKPQQEFRDPRFAELDRLIAAKKQGSRTSRVEPAKRTNPTRKCLSRPLPREYRREISRMAREHRRKYQTLFASDPRLKDRAGRFYRSLLPPKPRRRGRPPIGGVSKAIRLLKKFRLQYPDEKPEKHWARVYPLVIPGYSEMGDVERRHEREQLRERVRWRRRTRRRPGKDTT